MNTDLELYRVFCEVVKHKNISKTAESMYISQSAVTQSIQKLENVLGGKVFYRNKNGVELTEEGKNLYEYIKNSIETMSNAENLFSQYVNLEKGQVRIGGGNSLVSSLIMKPLIEYMKEYPDINITIGSGITDVLMQSLANGELDLVVLNLPYNTKKYSNIEIVPLKKAQFSFYASKEYTKQHSIKNMKDLENCTLILPKSTANKRKILEEYCKKENITVNPKYEMSSSTVMSELVLNNVGVGFTNIENLQNIKNEIEIIKTIETSDTEEGIATLKRNMMNKATVELVRKIKENYKKK